MLKDDWVEDDIYVNILLNNTFLQKTILPILCINVSLHG